VLCSVMSVIISQMPTAQCPALSAVSVMLVCAVQCYERYNKPDANGTMPGSQRCGMLIKAAMYGAKDTPTCIRRSNTIRNLSPRTTYCTRITYLFNN